MHASVGGEGVERSDSHRFSHIESAVHRPGGIAGGHLDRAIRVMLEAIGFRAKFGIQCEGDSAETIGREQPSEFESDSLSRALPASRQVRKEVTEP